MFSLLYKCALLHFTTVFSFYSHPFFIPSFLPLSPHFSLLSFVGLLKALLPFVTNLSKLLCLLFFGVLNGAVFKCWYRSSSIIIQNHFWPDMYCWYVTDLEDIRWFLLQELKVSNFENHRFFVVSAKFENKAFIWFLLQMLLELYFK